METNIMDISTGDHRISDDDIASRAEGRMSLLYVELEALNPQHPLVCSYFEANEAVVANRSLEIWHLHETREFVPGQDDHLLTEYYVRAFESAILEERRKATPH
jgi:hypothetical protein